MTKNEARLVENCTRMAEKCNKLEAILDQLCNPEALRTGIHVPGAIQFLVDLENTDFWVDLAGSIGEFVERMKGA